MPLFRINSDLHYFAHVPKCGGMAVDTYLMMRFGTIGFRDPNRFNLPPEQRWSRTSPVHMPVTTLRDMIPPEWLKSSFAVVRHPVRRLVSAFCFARDFHRYLPLSTDFNTWFHNVAPRVLADPFLLGGHFAPMVSFVPEGARIFRLEDGLDPIIPHLDKLAGDCGGPRHIAASNVGQWRGSEAAPVPSAETLALINRLYAGDFERFGYAPVADPEALTALPDLPVLPTTGSAPIPPPLSRKNRFLRTLTRKAGL
jgi:Sulfotransferase family